MTEDNKRIELTEDNIDYNGMTDNLEINVTADMNLTDSPHSDKCETCKDIELRSGA